MQSLARDADATATAAADRAVMPPQILLLLVAVSAGVVAQGGYYAPGRVLVLCLVAIALVVALFARPLTRADLGPATIAVAPLALWALVRATTAGDYPAAAAEAATLACLVAVLTVLRRTDPAVRATTAAALLGIGALVAFTAWLGVAFRLPRFAVLVEHRLWRGASTLTYPNAAAALLASLALLAIALLAARPRSVTRALTAYLLLVGVGAALSRAGFLALAVGFVVLAVVGGVRAILWQSLAPVIGAATAVAALAPSFPVDMPARPAPAVLGLLAGAVIAGGAALLRDRVRALALAAIVGGGGVLAASQFHSNAVKEVWRRRASLDSSGRAGALHAAFDTISHRPLAGAGVGLARFVWTTPDNRGSIALYVHNEYVQTMVDLGVIGLVLLLGLVAGIAVYLYQARTTSHVRGIRAGAVAALVAFAVHSGFDFLWHIEVLPLVAALFIGLAGPVVKEEFHRPEAKGE